MTRPLRLVHVAEADIAPTTGMGRVAWHWQAEAHRRGHTLLPIGPQQVGPLTHPRLFPGAARRAFDQLTDRTDALLVHEPASGAFLDLNIPLIVVSHGIERRLWDLQRAGRAGQRPSLRTRMFFPWWRLRLADRGLRHGHRLYLISRDDVSFARDRYGRQPDDIFAFRNGVDPVPASEPTHQPHVLFIGSWIDRKGTDLMTHAASLLHQSHPTLRWTLAGTGSDAGTVAAAFPEPVRAHLDIQPRFAADQEHALFEGAPIFVLPSTFEGQPLALLQAMAAGCCCITTDTCGQRDLIDNERNGLLIPVGDKAAFVLALTRVLNDQALRNQLGAAARASVIGRSWSAVSAEVIDDLEAFLLRTTHP